MPQVVPTEIVDSRPLKRRIPGLSAELHDWPAAEAEHVRLMLAELLTHDPHRFTIERSRKSSHI
jgi:hypothetical protein